MSIFKRLFNKKKESSQEEEVSEKIISPGEYVAVVKRTHATGVPECVKDIETPKLIN